MCVCVRARLCTCSFVCSHACVCRCECVSRGANATTATPAVLREVVFTRYSFPHVCVHTRPQNHAFDAMALLRKTEWGRFRVEVPSAFLYRSAKQEKDRMACGAGTWSNGSGCQVRLRVL